MTKDIEDISKLGQMSMDNTLKMWGEWAKSWQAVTAEMGDYTKRSLEDGTKTFEKLATARTIVQVLEIQSSYAKRCCEDYMQQMTKIGTMCTEVAKDSAKPFERFAPARR